jgi:hypothetical protein
VSNLTLNQAGVSNWKNQASGVKIDLNQEAILHEK